MEARHEPPSTSPPPRGSAAARDGRPARTATGPGPLTPTNAVVARADGSAEAPVELNSGTIFVRPANLLPDGRVQFFLPSTPDQRYFIQASTNLVDWVTLSTNLATGTFLESVDVDAAAYPYRFYRWQAAD